MEEITQIFDKFIAQYDSVDVAESEFKMAIHEDTELRELYRDWCAEVGTTEHRGFLDYVEEYLETRNDVWNSLYDFDE